MLIVLFVIAFFACSKNVDSTGEKDTTDSTDTELKVVYHERAKAVYDKVFQYYYVADHNLFKENYPKVSGDREVSYLWPYFGLVAGVNTLMKIGYDNQELRDIIDRLDKYYDDAHNPVAYAAYPPSLGGDGHFYDDNSVVGLKFLNAYKITGETRFLEKAKDLMPFLYTGKVEQCGGGGIAWKESYISNPNDPNAIIGMSSSGYSTLLALKLYQVTDNQEYYKFGKSVYQWLKQNLKDPARNIYWNDVSMADCSINKDLWSYNTGVMMQIEIALYEITDEEAHLNEAQSLAQGAYNTFTHVYEGKRFYPDHDPWFNVKLFQGYLDLFKYDKDAKRYIDVFVNNANYAWNNARNEYDLFYEDWTGNKKGRDEWLLNQVSLIEMYGRISQYKGEEIK